MKYALNINKETRRILSVTYEKYAPSNAILVEELPDGDITNYLYVNEEYVYEPLLIEQPTPKPTQLDRIEAQVTYTALMTNTLIEEGQ